MALSAGLATRYTCDPPASLRFRPRHQLAGHFRGLTPWVLAIVVLAADAVVIAGPPPKIRRRRRKRTLRRASRRRRRRRRCRPLVGGPVAPTSPRRFATRGARQRISRRARRGRRAHPGATAQLRDGGSARPVTGVAAVAAPRGADLLQVRSMTRARTRAPGNPQAARGRRRAPGVEIGMDISIPSTDTDRLPRRRRRPTVISRTASLLTTVSTGFSGVVTHCASGRRVLHRRTRSWSSGKPMTRCYAVTPWWRHPVPARRLGVDAVDVSLLDGFARVRPAVP